MQANLTKTWEVLGDYKTPVELATKVNNGALPPDMVDIREVQQILGHRTTYTEMEWWRLFPVKSWWRYAIMATRAWGGKTKGGAQGKPNYRYFLKCLLEASRQTKRFKECWAQLRRFFGTLTEGRKGDPLPPPTAKAHDGNCTCESCWGTVQQRQNVLLERRLSEQQAKALVGA